MRPAPIATEQSICVSEKKRYTSDGLGPCTPVRSSQLSDCRRYDWQLTGTTPPGGACRRQTRPGASRTAVGTAVRLRKRQSTCRTFAKPLGKSSPALKAHRDIFGRGEGRCGESASIAQRTKTAETSLVPLIAVMECTMRSRRRGAMIGLAVRDALEATIKSRDPGNSANQR
jgi:hypothetical protein